MAAFLFSIDISSIASSFSSTGNFPHELTIKNSICHSKDLVYFFFFFFFPSGSYYVNVFPTDLTRLSFSVSETALIGQILVQTVICCLPPDAAEPLWSPAWLFFPQIMRPVITILIGINKKWVMAQDTFANSTQRMEYQGIKHTWEGSYNLMKIQLAHLRNGLCTRNKLAR